MTCPARRQQFVLAGAFLLVAAFAVSCGSRPEAETPAAAGGLSHSPVLYDEATFSEAVRDADGSAAPQGEVAGGIIPHHWLAGRLITGFFQGLAAEDPPKTIVLIGPNHPNAGSALALTSDLSWATPFGVVEPDRAWIDGLVEAGLVEIEPPILTTEHSVASMMPAIAYYLPDARVVPIILSGKMGPQDAKRIGDALAARWDGDTVVVAAVDFSHYLVRREAERHDEVTLQALRTFDRGRLFTFGNDNLDSPPSIAVLMEVMLGVGADEFVLLANTNSGVLMQDELIPTTSYFVGYYPVDAAAVEGGHRP